MGGQCDCVHLPRDSKITVLCGVLLLMRSIAHPVFIVVQLWLECCAILI